MRKLGILCLLAALLCGPAHAQQSAAGHFDKARALYDKGMWSAAGVELRKAREAITTPEAPLKLQCDYMIAMCASAAGDANARVLAEGFLQRYPHTIYHNDVMFALAGELYKEGDWGRALPGYLAVDPFALSEGKRSEYYFKLGHSYFLGGDRDNAYRNLRQVDASSAFANPASYYIAYLDYAGGDYAAAKRGFQSIANDPAYAPIVPYYLIQIEFLQGNFSYVTANADALIKASSKARAAETARIAAESWYHLGDYPQALKYMDLFVQLGGQMGREENYITGYCMYMQQDYTGAAGALGLVVGPEDALSQNAAYHLAACYLQLGRKKEAMQSFSIAAVGNYDQIVREDALFNYGKLQYELGGGVFNEAINVLNRYIKEYPSSPRVNEAREYLLSAYYNSRNYEAAYDAIMLIPNPDNNVKAALQKITYFRALEKYNAGDMAEADCMLQLSAGNRYNAKYTALAAFWRGEIAYARADYASAVPFYRDFLAVAPASEPEYPAAHYALGYCYFNRQKWDEAGAWFSKYINLRPTDKEFLSDAYNRMGDVKYSGRSFWQAIEEYDKIIKLGTQQKYYGQWRRAFTLGLVDRTPRKIESLQEIIRDGKGEWVDEAMYELGRTYMTQERFSDAATTLTRYVETYPNGANYIDALSDLGLTYQNMGQSDRSLQYYKQIVATAPGSPQAKDAMLGIRSVYVERNDVDAYFAYASGAGVEADLSAMSRDSLSFASAQRQYLTGAARDAGVTAMRGYLNGFPKGTYRAQALSLLGDASLRNNDRAGAQGAYKELTEMHFNDYTVHALEELARMSEEDKDYAASLGWYRTLSRTVTAPAAINHAFEGALRAAKHLPAEQMLSLVAEILESPYADKNVTRQAQFIKAKSLPEAQALQIYEKLAVESQTAEGAESSYRVIESLAAAGNNAAAKKRIFALSDQNSPHTYWTGRAFLILGGIYVNEGDTFQARATFQSIVDGYPDPKDGIVESARASISKLK
ncbi:MAG: tetratricopeptide repeat protein [Rikenellaceae bacterium]|jgi:TolA-binding protein|nr:tetratricopeptide repeat protein [Rikenellaceae bacterium]